MTSPTEYSVVGNQVWGIYRKDGYDPEVILILLSQNDGYWGYKPILESESPFYYDCPLKYLNHLDSGKSWREFVREAKPSKTKKAVRLWKLHRGFRDRSEGIHYHQPCA